MPRRSPCRSGRPRLRRGTPSSSRTAALGRPVAFIALRSPVRGSSRARRRPARTRPQPSILAAWFRASRSSAPTRSAVRRWWSSRLRWARRGRRQGNLLLSGSLRSEKGKGSSRPGSPSAIPSTPMIRRSPSRGARRAGRRTRFPASSKPDAAAVAFALVRGDSNSTLGAARSYRTTSASSASITLAPARKRSRSSRRPESARTREDRRRGLRDRRSARLYGPSRVCSLRVTFSPSVPQSLKSQAGLSLPAGNAPAQRPTDSLN